ncbi:MAG: hypothetical protein P4M09_13505 [Devosia sp.]|nr:hypothetical protein [Devosia sp.]
MINLEPLARKIGVVWVIIAAAGAVVPAYAGPAEVALLKSYEGSWKGTGKVVGTDTEMVNCRMSLTPGNDDKVNYAGRCALAGSNLSINGTLAYIENSHRYEGAMTSNVNFSGVAVGQKTGAGIVFNLVSRGQNEGVTIEIRAGITLTPNGIIVNFKATDVDTGKVINAVVPFAKS